MTRGSAGPAIAAAGLRARVWTDGAGLAMAAMVALGPLELREGLHLAGLQLSTTELLVALALATALAAVVMQFRAGIWLRPHLAELWLPLALVAWAGVHLASAAWAPADRGLVVKYGLRVAGGTALAGAVWALASDPVYRQRLGRGVLVGLGMVTLLGVLERGLGRAFEPFLQQFRDEPTWMLGEQRLSTVFAHANTCAAYLELTAPFLVVVAAQAQGRIARFAWLAWLLLVAGLLSLTYSRAGLLAGVCGAGVLVAATRYARRLPPLAPDRRPRRVAQLAVIFSLSVVAAYVANPEMRARIGLDARSYRVAYRFPYACIGHVDTTLTIPIVVQNVGEWPLSNRQAPGRLMATWLAPDGRRVRTGWHMHPLPEMLRGDRAELRLAMPLPSDPGLYVLGVDVLRAGVLRVSQLGNPMGWWRCLVAPKGADLSTFLLPNEASAPPSDLTSVATVERLEIERRHYWRAALLLFERNPWLGLGADRFRFTYREYVPWQAFDPRARAHSVVFETAANLGLLGLLALGLLVVVVARQAVASLRSGGVCDGLAVAAAAALGGLAVHSQVDYFLAYTQLTVVVWPLVGLCGCRLPSAGGCNSMQTDACGV